MDRISLNRNAESCWHVIASVVTDINFVVLCFNFMKTDINISCIFYLERVRHQQFNKSGRVQSIAINFSVTALSDA